VKETAASPAEACAPKVLAIDTTAEFGSIALVEGATVIEEVPLHAPDGFAHILFQHIEGLLKRHGMELAAFDGFAAAAGPGSFTGVRVGLTAVKGLADATGRPVVAVSNLQALAWFGSRALRAPVLDARRGVVYGAVYNAVLDLVQEETVVPLRRWLVGLPAGEVEIITNGFPLNHERVTGPVVQAQRSLAGAIGRIAVARLAASGGQDPAEVDANYIRRSDAELAWMDLHAGDGSR